MIDRQSSYFGLIRPAFEPTPSLETLSEKVDDQSNQAGCLHTVADDYSLLMAEIDEVVSHLEGRFEEAHRSMAARGDVDGGHGNDEAGATGKKLLEEKYPKVVSLASRLG